VTATKGKNFLIVAVMLGMAAAIVGYYGLTSMASHSTAQQNANFKNVVVTVTDLTYGVKLDKEMLRMVRYPKESVPEGAFSSMDSVVGQTTKVFMSAREPVTIIKLSSRGGGLSMLVRPKMRAALRFAKERRRDWADYIDRVLNLVEGTPLFAARDNPN